MKTIRLVVSLLGCIFSLDAQITVRVIQMPDGSNRTTIRNDGVIPLVAYTMAATVRGGGHSSVAVYSDLTVNPLLQNQELSETLSLSCVDAGQLPAAFATGNRNERKEHLCELDQPRFGGVLANGSTIGDPVLFTRTLLRRHGALLALDTALDTFFDASRRNLSREQLIQEFMRRADSLGYWHLFSEQESVREICLDMVGKLMNLANVPSGAKSSMLSFIAEQSGMLKQQRSALLKSQPIWPKERWPHSVIFNSPPGIESR